MKNSAKEIGAADLYCIDDVHMCLWNITELIIEEETGVTAEGTRVIELRKAKR